MGYAAAMPSAGLRSSERETRIARLEAERFDLAVIGGGITGAGIAHEAARRGLRVALLEAGDFAAGTSSRSSKLIHGGLRYLALGDVATVRSTALERKVLHRIAPHLAEPHWMVVPARSRAGLMKLRAALSAYEKLGEVEPADRHRNWSGEELARGEPILDRTLHPHACVYREYVTDDARLVLANLRAAASHGAAVLSRAPVQAILREGGQACGVEVACAEASQSGSTGSTGSIGSGGRFRVRARCVVNAAGPWVDAVRALEDPLARPKLQLSKGVHVVFRRERLPLRNILILGTQDRRSIFAVPRGEAVYVGTTDTSWAEGQTTWVDQTVWPRIERGDVEYLLAPLHRQLGADGLGPQDVFAAWAGLRPLVAEPGKPPTEISRKDEVTIGPAGVVSIAGGKLTGYRPMAHATLERAAEHAGLRLAPAREPDPLPGGAGATDLAALARSLVGVPEAVAARLARAYGDEAPQVLERGASPLAEGAGVVAGEVNWALDMEDALHLEDVLYRRTGAALYDPVGREALLDPVAARMAERLGWSAARREAELVTVRERLAEDLAFKDRAQGSHDPAAAREERR